MHIKGLKVVEFDMRQFGCKDKGPMGMQCAESGERLDAHFAGD